MSISINPAVLLDWLRSKAEVPADRAAAAAVALVDAWNGGDLGYQTAREILGGHLSDDAPRPKLIADDLAAHVGLKLVG
jgi:hypothetical protein